MENKLAAFIAARRLEHGLTQEELSLKIGANRSYIGQVEKGRIDWPDKFARKIADTLDITVDDLLAAAGRLDTTPSPDLAAEIRRIARLPPDKQQAARARLPSDLLEALDNMATARAEDLLRLAIERLKESADHGHDR